MTWNEIEPSKAINAFGRIFRILSVDEFTHHWYMEKQNKHFDIGGIEMPKPREPKPRVIPPHNGFGDEQDSLGYVYKL